MKHPLVHAVHILECIEKLENIYRKDPDFVDEYYCDAVLRNLQTMAASTKHIHKELRQSNPHIDWEAIWGFRNVLVHDYLGDIDAIIIKNVLQKELLDLKAVLEHEYPNWQEMKKKFLESI